MKIKGKAKGGHARAAKLSPARRKAIARKAAKARWESHELGGDYPAKARPFMKPAMDAMKPKVLKTIELALKKTISAKPRKRSHEERMAGHFDKVTLRDTLALAVLQGMYSNIADAQKFCAYVMGDTVPLPEALVRVAYAQADEAIRWRSL